ncbi:hypothetical protein HJC22_41905 [Corallococcus exiguus]|uniref:hypothetical protein n=1 Tax=Corallococcus exiguus TaxID=83462 RepID=UPI00147119F8|nr:hypothetical protein [Corallococcus exiguus]NNC22260.1 hypothetical protein [Corallococcus exiguus]
MAGVFARGALLAVTMFLVSACGGPVESPETPSGNAPTPAQVAEEMAGYNWQDQEENSSGTVTAQYCALEYVQPCIADVAICAVRCCDDSLFKSAQVCGNCGTWAAGACANHGTRKRIRWE